MIQAWMPKTNRILGRQIEIMGIIRLLEFCMQLIEILSDFEIYMGVNFLLSSLEVVSNKYKRQFSRGFISKI